jgi:hypothetical protein
MLRVITHWFALACCWFSLTTCIFAEDLGYFFPEAVEYDKKLQSPKAFFGFEIGERHLQHHELVAYLKHLSDSPRVKWVDYGTTHGNRPLVVLQISSAKNIKSLDRIQKERLELLESRELDHDEGKQPPAVIWMGYGVHGNEPSASNAAALIAYYLIAGKSKLHSKLLSSCVILLDPCLNPDGFDRFANWSNSHRGQIPNPDPQHREHNELSPTGRTNYYWFDLNRDWLPLQQPESVGRIELFNAWRPNVVLDYHEMGANSSYFFQPGVPGRANPWIPKRNQELTREFSQYHARALDRLGSLYFTEEKFDDFYIGKGSSYPDVRGSIGILFEQASARGQMQESVNGLLEFKAAIRNQIATSLSSLEATVSNQTALNRYLVEFYRESAALAAEDPVKAFVFHAGSDHVRAREFIQLLQRHDVQTYRLNKSLTIGDHTFDSKDSYAVPLNQREYRLLMAMVESRTEFEYNTFYDISAWSLPLAFGLTWAKVTDNFEGEILEALWSEEPVHLDSIESPDAPNWSEIDYAYLVEWNSSHAARTLNRLHSKEIIVKAATQSFEVEMNHGEAAPLQKRFREGTLLIPLGLQRDKAALIQEVLEEAIREDEVRVTPVSTGLTAVGVDLGSDAFKRLVAPKVLMVVGTGVSDYEAGEVWHHFDQNLRMPITMVDTHRMGSTNLAPYTHLITVSGSYAGVPTSAIEPLQNWLKAGGTWIATGTSAQWLNQRKIATFEFRKREGTTPLRLPYGEAADLAVVNSIQGSIFDTDIDLTHPLAYGLGSNRLPVFRGHTMFVEPSKNPYSTPLIYRHTDTLLSGYASAENLSVIAGSAAVLVQSEGAGRVIVIADNPVFRGYWRGTQRLLENGIFFGSWINEPRVGEQRVGE